MFQIFFLIFFFLGGGGGFILVDILSEPDSSDNKVDWFILVHILIIFWVKFHKILMQILNVLLHHVKYH